MGQILSNLWCWICPKPRNKALPSSNDDHKAKYQTLLSHHDENQQQSHRFNNSSDHHHDYVRLISGCSSPNENYATNLDHSTSHSVVDLSSECVEHAKKKKQWVELFSKNHGNEVIIVPETLLEYYSSSSSTPHIVLDLIDESGEESVDDRVIEKEIVSEKNVTTSVNYVSYNVTTENVVSKIGAYTSDQRQLLVGEGDFSFSASLAVAFGYSARNIIATSLNNRDFLIKNYRKFPNNKAELETRGSLVLHGVDATKMVDHPILGSMVFDRVIYNFPHAGKFGKGDLELRIHQKLISGFLQNAKKMIGEDGEIHITSKCNGFFLGWDIPKLGSDQGLYLIQAVKFNRLDYPGYRTKYGFGGDANFHCSPSKTYKFGLLSPNKTNK